MSVNIYKLLHLLISKRGLPFTFAFSVFIIIKLSVPNPWIVEKIYSNGFYIVVANILSFVSRIIPFSLWDITWMGLLLLLVTGFFLMIFRKLKPGKFTLYLLQTLAVMYSLFYLLWGLNYFRPSVEERIGLESVNNNPEQFKIVLNEIIVQTNNSYVSSENSDKLNIDKAVEESYRKNAEDLGIIYSSGCRGPKEITLSSFFAGSGVSGYFGPFFNEIHVNKILLHTEYPFVLAHEKAHQFGITSEAEANLYAFIICSRSSEKTLRYSAYITILQYFLNEVGDPDTYKEFIAKIDQKVIKDIQKERKNWTRYYNRNVAKIQTAANDAYLKSNRIEEGVINYNRVVSLVMGLYLSENIQ